MFDIYLLHSDKYSLYNTGSMSTLDLLFDDALVAFQGQFSLPILRKFNAHSISASLCPPSIVVVCNQSGVFDLRFLSCPYNLFVDSLHFINRRTVEQHLSRPHKLFFKEENC